MHKAASNDHDDVVKLLIDHMTIKMPQDARGWSPLHFSAYSGNAGCPVFKEGIQHEKDFCITIIVPNGKY